MGEVEWPVGADRSGGAGGGVGHCPNFACLPFYLTLQLQAS